MFLPHSKTKSGVDNTGLRGYSPRKRRASSREWSIIRLRHLTPPAPIMLCSCKFSSPRLIVSLSLPNSFLPTIRLLLPVNPVELHAHPHQWHHSRQEQLVENIRKPVCVAPVLTAIPPGIHLWKYARSDGICPCLPCGLLLSVHQ